MKPLGDIIYFETVDEKSKIILTDKPQSPVGKAIAVGDKVTEIKEGDEFYYYGRMTTEWEGNYMCRESDIVARIDK